MTTTTASDRQWLAAAIELSRLCPPSETAFSVGTIIVDTSGTEVSRGYSRETDPHVHAEESALAKVTTDTCAPLNGGTIYTSLEPCTARRSRPHPCAQLIRDTTITRVVLAMREPPLFVENRQGVEMLTAAGIEVIQVGDMSDHVRDVNHHLLNLNPNGWNGQSTRDREPRRAWTGP